VVFWAYACTNRRYWSKHIGDTIEVQLDIRSLLTYSNICGIGLDTMPIPGDTAIEKISGLMRNTGTMVFRFNIPLTVHVFPVLGLKQAI
jgi:uncharacterized protein (UPF0210 family)